MPDGRMDLVLLEVGSSAPSGVLVGQSVGSSVIGDCPLTHQAVVVALDGTFHDGSEGNGLIGALSVLLNGRDQFHHLIGNADAVLLGGIGVIVCHCYWVGVVQVSQGIPPTPAADRTIPVQAGSGRRSSAATGMLMLICGCFWSYASTSRLVREVAAVFAIRSAENAQF
jgi:hypothetical protein